MPGMNRVLLAFLLFLEPLSALDPDVPLFYRGRIHPASAYAALFLEPFSQKENLETLWRMHFLGDEERPIFKVRDPALRKKFKTSLFSYNQIKDLPELKEPIRLYTQFSSSSFLALPCRGEWRSLKALKNSEFNFTLYSDADFSEIQKTYLLLERAYKNGDLTEIKQQNRSLSTLLKKAYASLAGKPMQKAHGKALFYPTTAQLYAEGALFRIPFLEGILLLYLLSLWRKPPFFAAFALLTAFLGLRCYILNRPPVSNMYETLVYVPWIISAAGLLFYALQKKPIILKTSAISSSFLLLILLLGPLADKLENVQAVLDSQYWLTVHVLMVVGSYGFFILSGVLAHLALYRDELAKTVLHSLYIGTGLLIVGTILGGVWAAQSWGRFWDWDPKESWAFISACIYLILIHLYRFKHIGNYGLCLGAILGLQAIIFTWYGVNYILGTGLHSYGFGSGGKGIYSLFVLLEMAFIILNLSFNRKRAKILP